MSDRFKKRERTQNWTPEEKILLLKLCEDRLDVLESKRSDQLSIAKKGNAWQEIRAEFVQGLGIERDVSRLKEQWQRMKCQARADLQDFAMRLKKYGPEIANQKRPNQMSAEVWRVMESARKYFLHMNGADSEEDANIKEINWCLSEANCVPNSSSSSECDTAPSLLCETEVKTNTDDNNETNNVNATISLFTQQYNGYVTDCHSPGDITDHSKLDFFTKRDYVLTALANAQQQRNVNSSRLEQNNKSNINNNNNNNKNNQDMFQCVTVFFETKRIEQQKRLQIVEEQMKTARLYRETAEIQKQLAQQHLKYALLKFNKDDKDRTKSNSNSTIQNISDCCKTNVCSKEREDVEDDEYDCYSRKKIKEDLTEKLLFHEEQIRYHEEAIRRHKQRVLDIE